MSLTCVDNNQSAVLNFKQSWRYRGKYMACSLEAALVDVCHIRSTPLPTVHHFEFEILYTQVYIKPQ